MENKWDIRDFKTPEEFFDTCPVCNDIVRACDKCGIIADILFSISCGKSQGKGHICYHCWDELRTGESVSGDAGSYS